MSLDSVLVLSLQSKLPSHPRQRGMFARIALLHSTVEDAPTAACAPDGLFIVAEALTCRSNQNEICILTMAHCDHKVAISAKIKAGDFMQYPFIYFLKKRVIKATELPNYFLKSGQPPVWSIFMFFFITAASCPTKSWWHIIARCPV